MCMCLIATVQHHASAVYIISATLSGGLRIGTPTSEHDFSHNFNHYISRKLYDMDKEVAPQDR